MTARLVVLHAPGYAPEMDERVVEKAEALGADSIGWSEVYRMADRLSSVGYWCQVRTSPVSTRAVRSPRGDAGDNPISVRRRRQVRRSSAVKVTDPGQPLKYAPERWVYTVTYQWDRGLVTHISAHPSPLFVGNRPWRAVMRVALGEVKAARRRGEDVVLSGDFQTGRLFCKTMLRAAGLRVWNDGVDYVCHSKGLRRVSEQTIRVDGLDHPWMLAHLERT